MSQSLNLSTSAQFKHQSGFPPQSEVPALKCQRTVLENGLTVLVTENPVADIVAARIFIDAGSRRESLAQAGLSQLVAAVLTKGTTAATAKEIATRIESVGANLGVDSTPDYFLLTLKTVSSDFASMLTLAAQLLQTPTFPSSELELERKLTLQAIRSRQEQPMTIALQQLRQAIYLEHPYGQPSLGSLESVESLTQGDLHQFHGRYFRSEQTIISIAGNISVSAALDLAAELFLPWQPDAWLPIPAPANTVATQPTRCDTIQDNQQSIVMLGYLAPAVQDADHAALKLLHTYLCGGLSSRLFTELREKRGLAYEVSGYYPTRLDPSYFAVYIGTAAENTTIAQDLLQAEIQRLANQPLSETELNAAKSKFLGQYALGKQTNHQIAHTFGWYEYLNLGIDYDRHFPALIQSVTPESAHRAAHRYFGEPYVSRVGPSSALSPTPRP
jgi:zinc protease